MHIIVNSVIIPELMPRLGNHQTPLHPCLLHDTKYPLDTLLNRIFPLHPGSAHGAMSTSPPSTRPAKTQVAFAQPKHLYVDITSVIGRPTSERMSRPSNHLNSLIPSSESGGPGGFLRSTNQSPVTVYAKLNTYLKQYGQIACSF